MVEFKFIEGECFKIRLPDNDDFELVNRANSIPGAKYIKSKDYWKWPLSVRIYRALKEAFGVEDERLDEELNPMEIAFHENLNSDTFGGWQRLGVMLTLKEFGFTFAQSPYLEDEIRNPLLPRGFALFMEMGTRKTSTVINIVDTLFVNDYVKSALVIAPLPVIDTWANSDPEVGQLSCHSSIPHLTFTATGSKATKEVAISSFKDFKTKAMKWLLMNPEGIGSVKTVKRKKVHTYTKGLEEATPDFLIIDESTIIKNYNTARGKLIEKLLYHTPYKIIMSGNPTPKGGHEIFGQYLVMDKGVFGDNFYRFRDRYFNLDYFNGIDSPKEEKEKEFNDLFHSSCYVVRKDDCLDLPPKTYESRVFEMGPEQLKAYKKMKKHALVAYEDLSCAAEVVITKYLRLSQITGGFLPLEDEEGKLVELRRFSQQPALDAMVADILLLPDHEQGVIWARFQEEIVMISERLTEEGITNAKFYGPVKNKDRIEARRQFREKEIRAFISSSAGSKGLNDLIGSTYVFYYSNDYSAETRQQSEDRNHRSGVSGEKVTYTDYIAKDSIDIAVLKVLRDNKNYSDSLLEERKRRKAEKKLALKSLK